MKYKPNTNNPRVAKRIRHAYGIARAMFSPTTEQQISQSFLNKHFGRSNDQLGRWLRKQLLICTDHHYSEAAGVAKSYVLNSEAADEIKQELLNNLPAALTPKELIEIRQYEAPAKQFDSFVVNKCYEQEYGTELKNLEFVYEDKSSRLWHPIQGMRKQPKKALLESYGLKWHYDIRCCAPTLIHQHAQQLGMDEYLFGINNFLSDRKAFRERITNECELLPEHGYDLKEEDRNKTSKTLINALFCGARLGTSPLFKLAQLLNNDEVRIEWLKQDEQLTKLREDIKTCWQYITPTMTRRRNNESGRLLPISSKQKWLRYFELERQVLNAARDFFKKTDNKCFLEHDGWSTQRQVDIEELKQHVLDVTGFRIEIDCETYTAPADAASDSCALQQLQAKPSATAISHSQRATLKEKDSDKLAPLYNPHVYDFSCVATASLPQVRDLSKLGHRTPVS